MTVGYPTSGITLLHPGTSQKRFVAMENVSHERRTLVNVPVSCSPLPMSLWNIPRPVPVPEIVQDLPPYGTPMPAKQAPAAHGAVSAVAGFGERQRRRAESRAHRRGRSVRATVPA